MPLLLAAAGAGSGHVDERGEEEDSLRCVRLHQHVDELGLTSLFCGRRGGGREGGRERGREGGREGGKERREKEREEVGRREEREEGERRERGGREEGEAGERGLLSIQDMHNHTCMYVCAIVL